MPANNKTISMNFVILAEKGDILRLVLGNQCNVVLLLVILSTYLQLLKESYATHTRSSIGGFKGRKVIANDVITVKINNDFKENIGKTISFTGRFDCQKIILYMILQGTR